MMERCQRSAGAGTPLKRNTLSDIELHVLLVPKTVVPADEVPGLNVGSLDVPREIGFGVEPQEPSRMLRLAHFTRGSTSEVRLRMGLPPYRTFS